MRRVLLSGAWFVAWAACALAHSPVVLAVALGLGALLPLGSRSGAFLFALAAAAALQGGISALAVHRLFYGAVLLAVFAAALTVRTPVLLRLLPARPLWNLAVCGMLLLLAMLPVFPRYGDSGNADPLPEVATDGNPATPPNSPSQIAEAGGTHDGVLIFPEVKKITVLYPPLPAMKPNLFSEAQKEPFSIPFAGVYWLYKWPYAQPPRGSLTVHGSPTDLSFRSTDHRDMQMEARQDFGKRIDLSCCRELRLGISNGERINRSVFMELVLVDSAAPGRNTMSLGLQPVIATPRWIAAKPYPETLSFEVPRVAAIGGFDGIIVRYRMERSRASKSARISIDRLTFVPR